MSERNTQNWLHLWTTDCFQATYPFHRFDLAEQEIFLRGSFWDLHGQARSVVEVAAAIVQKGQRVLDDLDGSFSILVADPKRKTAWCATDPKGFFSVYYSVHRDGLHLTNDASLLAAMSSKGELDSETLFAILNSGYPWGGLTLFRDIRILMPGSLLEWRDGKATERHYFSEKDAPTVAPFASEADVLEELDRALLATRSRRNRWLIPMSGGVDSRLIAIRAHQLGISFEAVTITGRIGKQARGSDFDIAQRLAERLGVKHHQWEWCSGDVDPIDNVKSLAVLSGGMNSALFTYLDGMNGWRDVVASFDCAVRGDETFGWDQFSWSAAHALHVLNVHAHDWLGTFTNPEGSPLSNASAADVLAATTGFTPTLRGRKADAWKQAFYWQTRIPRFVLPVARWQALHVPMEFPFLERRFIHRMHQTEPALRADKRIIRDTLRLVSEQVEGVGRIPFSTSRSFMPAEPWQNLLVGHQQDIQDILRISSPLDAFVDKGALANAMTVSDPPQYEECSAPPSEPFSRRLRRRFKGVANLLGVFPRTHVPLALIVPRVLSLQLFLLHAPKDLPQQANSLNS